MKIQQIIKTLNELKPVIREKYNVKELGIFGSYTHGVRKKMTAISIYS